MHQMITGGPLNDTPYGCRGARTCSMSTTSQIELRETEQHDSDALSQVFPHMFDFWQHTDSFKRGKTVYYHVILEFNSELDAWRL